MKNRRFVAWERRLKELFDTIDDHLEDTYGARFSIHPSRPRRGSTANKEADGLFNVGASFSPGFGSSLGRGFVVDVDVATLESVPSAIRSRIESDIFRLIRDGLPLYFPGSETYVGRDNGVTKIFGTLSKDPTTVRTHHES